MPQPSRQKTDATQGSKQQTCAFLPSSHQTDQCTSENPETKDHRYEEQSLPCPWRGFSSSHSDPAHCTPGLCVARQMFVCPLFPRVFQEVFFQATVQLQAVPYS